MTQEEKSLLLKDLCARLPYDVICACEKYNGQLKFVCPEGDYCVLQNSPYAIETIKPYLRPMSSMTEEEEMELHKLNFSLKYKDCFNRYAELINYTYENPVIRNYPNQKNYISHDVNETICVNLIDWLNAHHFDYRGLIEKGLALPAPDGMYNIKEIRL